MLPVSGAANGQKGEEWLTSVEVRKVLKISTCDLAHLREEGNIRAEKRGNAYYYPGKMSKRYMAASYGTKPPSA